MAATPGTFSPFPLGRGSRNGLRTYNKEEYDLNAEDAEVHSGGSDVVSYSSTQLVYAVHGVVEHFQAYAVPGGLPDLP